MNDAPRSGYNSNTHEVRMNVGFTTWLMFKADDADSQWVPLRSISWSGGGRATKTTAGAWTVSYSYGVSASPSAETILFPEWDYALNLNLWTAF